MRKLTMLKEQINPDFLSLIIINRCFKTACASQLSIIYQIISEQLLALVLDLLTACLSNLKISGLT
jgi:hypothetical protein